MTQKEVVLNSIFNNLVDNKISDKKFFDIIDEHSVNEEMLQEIFYEIEKRNIILEIDTANNSYGSEFDVSEKDTFNSKSKQTDSTSIKNKYVLSESNKNIYIQRMVDNLPALRAKSGLTQAELAELVGVSRQTILSAEKKQRELTWSMFLALLIVFGSYEKTAALIEIFEIRPEGFKQIVSSSLPHINQADTTSVAKEILNNRHKVYEAAKAAHPERWNGRSTRDWTNINEAHLNPDKDYSETKPIVSVKAEKAS